MGKGPKVLLSKSLEVRDRLLTLCAAYGISTDCVPLAISVVCTATERLLQGDVEVFLARLEEFGGWPSPQEMDPVWVQISGVHGYKFNTAVNEVSKHRSWEGADQSTLIVAAVLGELDLIPDEQRGPHFQCGQARLKDWQGKEMPWLNATALGEFLHEERWLQCPGTVRNWVLESPEEVLVKYVH